MPGEQLPSAVALASSAQSAGRLGGPAIAAVIYASLGPAWCFAVNSASYVAVVVALLLLRRSAMLPRPRTARGAGQLRAGLRFIRHSPLHRGPLIANAVIGCLAFNFPLFYASLTTKDFHGGSIAFGIAESLNAVTAVLVGLYLTRAPRTPSRRTLALAAVALGVSLAWSAAAPTLGIFYAGMLYFDAAVVYDSATSQALVQQNTPPELVGRVMSVYMLGIIGTTPIGGLIVGFVIDAVDPRAALALGAASALACGVISWRFSPVARASRSSLAPRNGHAATCTRRPRGCATLGWRKRRGWKGLWMGVVGVIVGIVLVLIVLLDVFESIVLPRRVTRHIRLTRLFFRVTWTSWSMLCDRFATGRRESALAYYGPSALILLLGTWAGLLILGYGLIQWGIGSDLTAPRGIFGFGVDVYYSGTTFFTLGMGDVAPSGAAARVATVIEAGTGFGLLALVIGYLPILYQAFSRREATVALLDARGGSPPSAVEILRRYQSDGDIQDLDHLLRTFEGWAADLLESHSSYPVLAYFRSQHDHQSWVAALTALLDTCALVMVGIDGVSVRTARWTYAMGCHAAVDLSQIFSPRPPQLRIDRLSTTQLSRVKQLLAAADVPLRAGAGTADQLADLRAAYEPYLATLARVLRMPLPAWLPDESALDDWQSSAWELSSTLPAGGAGHGG